MIERNDNWEINTTKTAKLFNKNGQRPKSHKTSVPNFVIGFVVYSSEENLQELSKVIKQRFKIKGRNEHPDCNISELEKLSNLYRRNGQFKQTTGLLRS